jgi:hypothetical protein
LLLLVLQLLMVLKNTRYAGVLTFIQQKSNVEHPMPASVIRNRFHTSIIHAGFVPEKLREFGKPHTHWVAVENDVNGSKKDMLRKLPACMIAGTITTYSILLAD